MSWTTEWITRSRTKDAEPGAQERIPPAPVPARAHVVAPLAPRAHELDDDLPGVEHDEPRDVRPVGQEGPVSRVRAASAGEPADGQQRRVGAARQQVAAARPAVRQEPAVAE